MGCVFVRFVMGDIDPLAFVTGDMKITGQIDDTIREKWRHGRVGICILALGFFCAALQDGVDPEF